MPYQHDVFISYKREALWTPWTRDHFKSLLQSYLQQDLGKTPNIFIDEHIDTAIGLDWVKGLGEHLATSRVVLPLFSRDYFASDWCIHELDLITDRARHHIIGAHPEERLILPVVGHDGDLFPDPISRLTMADVRKYRIAGMNKDTVDYHEFSKLIRELSPSVANAILGAPAFESSWVGTCVARFEEVYEAQQKGDRLAPHCFALKPMPTLVATPRLIV
jgi:hypothetical protein